MALALLAAIAGLTSPFFQKVFVDRLLGVHTLPSHAPALDWLEVVHPVFLIFMAFVCTLFAQAMNLLANYVGLYEGILLQRAISEDLFEKTLGLRADAMGSTTVGEVVSIYATDVPGSTAMIDQAIPMGAGIVFPLVFAPIAIRWICDIPIWSTVLIMLAMIVMNVTLSIRQSRFFYRYKFLAAERTAIVTEWVQNIRLLRILGWIVDFEAKIFAKRREETENRIGMVTNGQLMNSFGSTITYVINLTGIAGLVFFRAKSISAGDLFALLWIFGVFLTRPFRMIPWILTFTLDSLSSIRRLERFFARPSEVGGQDAWATEDAGPHEDGALAIDIKALNLTIGGKKLLRDIDLSVKPGEFVAIVGEVGSGKSLLILSMMGETGAEFEEYRIGKTDILGIDINERRRFFAYVPQEGFVMSASLRENVAFRYEVDGRADSDIMNSLVSAQFRPAAEHVPNGLDTEIGERGVNLSGGQRQRVSMSRAHFLARPVILLDDCLSAVDVDTERQLIRDMIDGAWKGRTRLLVTHRLSVLSRVDRIVFMEDGRIVDTGTFAELLARSARVREYVASVRRSEEAAQAMASGAAVGSSGGPSAQS